MDGNLFETDLEALRVENEHLQALLDAREETERILRADVEEMLKLVDDLLSVLPDSTDYNDIDLTWNFVWDELSDGAQELVKNARRSANELLKRLRSGR